jgi:hypothetical protein
MKVPPRQPAVDKLDAPDLDDTMTLGYREARCFSVEYDLAHAAI